MKHIELFESVEDFNNNKSKVEEPYVVLCENEDLLIYSGLTENDDNRMVKVLYKTDIEGYGDEVDYGDWYQYYGTETIDGNTYHKWQKVEDGGVPADRYILTDTDDFSNASLENPIEPIGNIYGDDVTMEGEYHGDLIVGQGEKPFETGDIDPKLVTKGDYIDLGLTSGAKWASTNLGATKAEEYGNYYAWGETTPKTDYSWSTYRYGSNYNRLTKYNTNSSYGTVDNKTVLDPSDDAVYVATGGTAHMPTANQIDELINETETRWGKVNGVWGRLFTGSNGNSIFIPASGNRYGSELYNRDHWFYVWSSSLSESGPNNGWCLYSLMNYLGRDSSGRFQGLSVRGLRD